jgi:hypothetical protein
MVYNLVYLEEMTSVPNVGMIIEQIDRAALLVTEEMRRYGLTLPTAIPGSDIKPKTVPIQQDVDTYLRFLVADAYVGFNLAKEEARKHGAVAVHSVGLEVPDTDIEGLPEYVDALFDVVVTGLQGAPAGFLTVRISRRLT